MALRERVIAAAALDVFEGEPTVNPALLTLPNVVLTPHIASASVATRRAMADLARVDPHSAARLSPGDAQRVQRALEVWRISGRTLTHWHAQPGPNRPSQSLPLVSLEPQDRSWLHARIATRFDAMLEAGLVAETQALRARGDLHAALPAMRCVGYRQAWAALDAGTEQGLRDAGMAATRQLAKRQLTWLRSMPSRTVVACDAPGALPRALEALHSAARHRA